MKPRRLKGHKAAVACCIASRARPGIIASSGEDGRICWFDLRCKDVLFTIDLGEQPISSLCFKAGNEAIVYASSGTKVSCLDIHMVSSWKPLETYNYNKDEINQIAYSSKSNFLAAADDSGDVKIIDTSQQCLYKTLRAVHTSICSSVQFLSWKPWTAITGGLDSKLAMWDFSRGRTYNVIDYGMPEVDSTVSCGNVGQCLNPAFVHSIAVPEMDMLQGLNKACAVARGDGVVDVIDLESELATVKSKNFQSRSKKSDVQAANHAIGRNLVKRTQLDYSLGGHTAAVSCVSFSLFGERGKFLISGGNDACVKLWDWSRHFCAEQTSCNNALILNIDLKKKGCTVIIGIFSKRKFCFWSLQDIS
ncbi:WD repeat-containing protein 53 isoform X2 [Phoenix dactylifera]|uniref:WD repeat-containing protein 53 isoform X2 n=1 Tax=Phoenix dactylifera TaxID=42345 RepID=A0A8B9AIY4_PHODC|nr:WD repeat-containing protein 53 isoform X2 [Phoenix dactylifera]